MKKSLLFSLALLSGFLVSAVNVTFRVDMSQQTVSPQGVQVAGSFNGWSTTATPMTHSGSNIYTVTLDLTAGTAYQYKFINGNTWAGEEIVPAACGVSNGMGGYNRQVTGPATTTVLDAVCFSQCGPCTSPVSLTLQVDMSQQTVSPNGVYVAGSFNNWSTTATPLTAQGNGVYAATFQVNGGAAYQYKFINGNTWAGEETVPSACGVSNGFGGYNREVTVATTNVTVPVVCFSQCGPCTTTQVQLTLQVDMSQQTVSPQGVYVAGSFNTWSPSATAMTHAGGNIYTATVSVNAGSTQQYKFINGNTWAGEESVPASCGVPNGSGGYNREVTLGSTNTTVPVVCFSQCGPCTTPVNVTFQVDMSLQTVSPDGVYLAGSFNNWSTTTTSMTHAGNSVYTATVAILGGTVHQYKFINGNTWAGEETVPAECGVSNGTGGYNREVTVATSNMTLPVVCFSQCGPCPGMVNLTLSVDMGMQTLSPQGVFVAGTFNGWNTASTPLTLSGGTTFSVTVAAQENMSHEYVFLNGDTWAGSEIVPEACGVPNGTGGFNRSVTLGTTPQTLPSVCFGMCTACPPLVSVTFRVDMSLETVAPEGVFIAGSFQGWNPATSPMLQTLDNVYEITFQLYQDETYEYKFINGNTFAGEETVPAECGVPNGSGGYNREVTAGSSQTILPVVCFSQCTACPVPYDVTFRVDMSQQTVSSSGVHIAGTFQGWDPAATPMDSLGNGVYEYTAQIMAGEEVQYKYINGNTWAEEETVPEECGTSNGTGGFNRYFTMPLADTTLPVVCYSECGPCQGSTLVEVIFHVDMGDLTVAPEGVHLAGSFQGWDPGATPMNYIGGGVYEKIVLLNEGDYVEYKFLNGNTWEGAEQVPEACGVPTGVGGFNRFLTVPAGGSNLPIVCFASCDPCPVGLENAESPAFALYPNPVKGILHIQCNQEWTGTARASLFNAAGQVLLQEDFNLNTKSEILLSGLPRKAGLALLKITTEEGKNYTFKLILD